jgi:outer membrane receptor protein involved in Fe transport
MMAHDAGRRRMSILLSAASIAVLASSAALGQTVSQSPPSAADDTKVREVVVTASRSGAQSAQNLAMAISVIDVAQVDQSGLGNLDDIAKFTPSLSITEGAPGYNKFDMRGLSTGGYVASDTSDRSLVAVYLDDTPISVQGQTPDLRIYDLERVEILRGPQGTLYGASSMAGTIRFVTAKPDAHSSFGTLEVTGADTEHGGPSYSLRGTFNTPLIDDKLALRAAFYRGQDGGYIDNIGDRNKKDANLNNSTQARVALRWTPSTKLTVDLSGTFEQSHAYGLNTELSALAPYTDSTNSPEGTRDSFQLYQLNINYDLGFADLVSSTAYTWRRIGFNASTEATIGYFFANYYGLPVSTTQFPVFNPPPSYSQAVADAIPAEHFEIDQKIHDEMQEFRLVSKNGGPIKWTAGIYFENQTRDLYQDIPVAGFDTLSYENLFYGPFNTPNGLYNSQTVDGAFNPNDIFSGLQNMTDTQVALFTDDTWHATSKLDLTAGVRYFNETEKYYLFESGVYGVVNHVPLTLNANQSSSGFNPRFNASYHVDKDLMVYAEAAKGFRFGGANQPVPIGSTGIAEECASELAAYGYKSAPLTFGPDHLWNYTVGEKASLLGGRMTLDADAYYIDWQDVQTRLGLNCSYFFTENKGSVTSQGLELESVARLTSNFTAKVSVGYNDSRANGDIPTVGAFNGDQSPYAPNWTSAVFLFYDHHLSDGMLHGQLSYQFRSEENTTYDPYSTTIVNGVLTRTTPSTSFAIIPPTHNVSASLAYDFQTYEIGLYGNNLIDGVKVTDIARAGYFALYQAGDAYTVARPRTVGIRLKAKF